MKQIRLLSVGALAGAAVLLGLATSAHAAGKTGTMTITPSSGLTGGQSVMITGSGFSPTSIGNFLQCNNATNEPTVHLGGLVNSDVGIGCTAPTESSAVLTTTSSTGTISKSYTVTSGTVGPPCGKPTDIITTCPTTDSAGQNPQTDAANYPCPPTAAQQAQGVQCVINFGDQAGDSAQAPITFQGETTGSSAPTTAAPVATTSPPTTAASTPTTAASTPTTAADTPTTPLANTGPGPGLQIMFFVGAGLMVLAAFVLLLGRRSWRGS